MALQLGNIGAGPPYTGVEGSDGLMGSIARAMYSINPNFDHRVGAYAGSPGPGQTAVESIAQWLYQLYSGDVGTPLDTGAGDTWDAGGMQIVNGSPGVNPSDYATVSQTGAGGALPDHTHTTAPNDGGLLEGPITVGVSGLYPPTNAGFADALTEAATKRAAGTHPRIDIISSVALTGTHLLPCDDLTIEGVARDAELTWSGSFNPIDVNGKDNVTIRNLKFRCSAVATRSYAAIYANAAVSDLSVQDCECDGNDYLYRFVYLTTTNSRTRIERCRVYNIYNVSSARAIYLVSPTDPYVVDNFIEDALIGVQLSGFTRGVVARNQLNLCGRRNTALTGAGLYLDTGSGLLLQGNSTTQTAFYGVIGTSITRCSITGNDINAGDPGSVGGNTYGISLDASSYDNVVCKNSVCGDVGGIDATYGIYLARTSSSLSVVCDNRVRDIGTASIYILGDRNTVNGNNVSEAGIVFADTADYNVAGFNQCNGAGFVQGAATHNDFSHNIT